VAQLRDRVEDFRQSIYAVLDGDSTRWHSDALRLRRDRIMRKREEAVEVSEGVQI